MLVAVNWSGKPAAFEPPAGFAAARPLLETQAPAEAGRLRPWEARILYAAGQ